MAALKEIVAVQPTRLLPFSEHFTSTPTRFPVACEDQVFHFGLWLGNAGLCLPSDHHRCLQLTMGSSFSNHSFALQLTPFLQK